MMMAESKDTTIGSFKVQLYAGLLGAEPQPVGLVTLPLKLSQTRSTTVEADLREAVDYAAQMVTAVFTGEVEIPPDDPELVALRVEAQNLRAAVHDSHLRYGPSVLMRAGMSCSVCDLKAGEPGE